MSDGWFKTDRGWRKSYGIQRDQITPGAFPCPRIVSDSMPLTEHVDGRSYDSKSAFRAVTKREGYTEVGNDTSRFRAPDKPKHDSAKFDASIRQAIAQNT